MATHSSILAWRIPWTGEILVIRLMIIIIPNLQIKKLRTSEAQKLIHVISSVRIFGSQIIIWKYHPEFLLSRVSGSCHENSHLGIFAGSVGTLHVFQAHQWLWLWASPYSSITVFSVGTCLDIFGKWETCSEGDGCLGSSHFSIWTMAVFLLLRFWE